MLYENIKKLLILTEIITHPGDQSVPVNSKVMFECTSSLSFNVTFSWAHNETSITRSTTSTLIITSVRYSDAGSYVCTVRSGVSTVVSKTATLTVEGTYGIIKYGCTQYRDGLLQKFHIS